MMSLINGEKNVCLVCSVETNSIHNSVNSCRACSAFFRRGILNHKNFRCRRGSKNCVMKPGDKLFCKYCRFQKCKAVGMVIKNITSELPTNLSFLKNTSNEIKIEETSIPSPPIEKLNLSNDIRIEDNKVLLDMKQINIHVNEIFSCTTSLLNNLNGYTTCLQRIIIGIKNLFTSLNYNHPENVVIVKRVELRRFSKAWQKFIICSPNLLMSLEEFASLSPKDKWIIFRNFWRDAFVLFTSIYLSKIKNSYCGGLLLCDETCIVKIDEVELFEPDIDDKKSQEIINLMKPTLILLNKFVHKPIKDENYDDIEIAYLVIQMMFDKLVLNDTTAECQKVGEDITKLVNDELHNYYIYNKKITNYAYRITEITKLLSFIKEYSTRQKEITLFSKWFNIIDFSQFDSI